MGTGGRHRNETLADGSAEEGWSLRLDAHSCRWRCDGGDAMAAGRRHACPGRSMPSALGPAGSRQLDPQAAALLRSDEQSVHRVRPRSVHTGPPATTPSPKSARTLPARGPAGHSGNQDEQVGLHQEAGELPGAPGPTNRLAKPADNPTHPPSSPPAPHAWGLCLQQRFKSLLGAKAQVGPPAASAATSWRSSVRRSAAAC